MREREIRIMGSFPTVVVCSLFAFSISLASDVYVISSSEDGFKVKTGEFVLDFKPLTAERRMALLYLEGHPGFCLGTSGQHGSSYSYFQWTTRVDSIEEDETSIAVKIAGRRENYWSYTAFFTFFKSFPGLLRLKIVVDLQSALYLTGELPQFICTTGDGQEVQGFQLALRSNCHGFMPLVINIVDNNNYLFSTMWMELTGKESFFGALKKGFEFHFDEGSFGLESPSGQMEPGHYVSADYLIYAWRDSVDTLSGIFSFLKAATSIVGAQLQEGDYQASTSMADSAIQSLYHPKHWNDVYAGWGLKAFLGGGETCREETQFVTNVDVLLGAAYYCSRTGEGDAMSLCRLITYNMNNFDGYYINDKGFYGGGWNQSGYEPVDPWGFIGCPLMLISAYKLLPDDIRIDLDKLKSHAERCIFMAKEINYDFPISIYPLTGEPAGGYGGNKKWDVCILYAKLMVEMYKLTGDGSYMEEADSALSHYMEQNYGKMCGSNTDVTGLSVALALYKCTGNQIYLNYFKKLCYQLVRWLNLYRGTFVDKEIPFSCVSEGLGSYIDAFGRGLFRYFLEEAYEETLEIFGNHPEFINFLNPYFVLYDFYTTFAPYSARYSFPRILGLPDGHAEGGIIDGDYWIPIEDLRPVWHREPWEFTRGQQIYGAGSQIIALMPRKFTGFSVEENDNAIPRRYNLHQNYPNPFRERTVISYQSSVNSAEPLSVKAKNRLPITLKIYDLTGRLIKSFVISHQALGGELMANDQYLLTITWDGRDDSGRRVASGTYFYALKSGDFVQVKRLTFIR